MSKPSDPHCSLSIFYAPDVSKAVILRKGPSRWCRMISWDLSTDRFELGQWLHARVPPRNCDLSPDGEWLIIFAQCYGGPHAFDCWTALCKPPYFTALACWGQNHSWGGGGGFVDSKHFYRSGPATATMEDTVRKQHGLIDITTWTDPELDGLPPASEVHARRSYVPSDIVIDGGKLFRRRDDGELRLLRDFTDMSFEEVKPPPGPPWGDG